MKPSEKVQAILTFVREMSKFDEKNPGFIEEMSYLFMNLPKCKTVTPFHRLIQDDPWIINFINKTTKAVLSKLYLIDWTVVKVISYEHFFVEHLKMVDVKYETLYNIL